MSSREDTAKAIISLVNYLQSTENCAAAIIPYAGGVICFGSREALLDMLKRAGEDDGSS